MTLHNRTGTDSAPAPGTTATRTPGTAIVRRMGGREYREGTRWPTCNVCQSDALYDIERAVIKGYAYTTIFRSLDERGQAQVGSPRNISEHVSRHLTEVSEVLHTVQYEERAKEIGLDLETAQGTLVDHISFAKIGLQKVHEAMVEGKLKPDIKDGIAFASLLAKVEDVGGSDFDQEATFRSFMVYMKALQQVCTPEQIQRFGQIVGGDPVIKALLSRSAPIVDGDVVPDERETTP